MFTILHLKVVSRFHFYTSTYLLILMMKQKEVSIPLWI